MMLTSFVTSVENIPSMTKGSISLILYGSVSCVF